MPGHDPQPWTPLARSCPEFLSPGHSLDPTPQVASLAQTFRACRGVRWTRPSHTEACLACRQAMQLLAEAPMAPIWSPLHRGSERAGGKPK